MIVGPLASSYHGIPRSTRDVDVVIDPDRASLATLLASFEPSQFYVGDGMAALAARDMSTSSNSMVDGRSTSL